MTVIVDGGSKQKHKFERGHTVSSRDIPAKSFVQCWKVIFKEENVIVKVCKWTRLQNTDNKKGNSENFRQNVSIESSVACSSWFCLDIWH